MSVQYWSRVSGVRGSRNALLQNVRGCVWRWRGGKGVKLRCGAKVGRGGKEVAGVVREERGWGTASIEKDIRRVCGAEGHARHTIPQQAQIWNE